MGEIHSLFPPSWVNIFLGFDLKVDNGDPGGSQMEKAWWKWANLPERTYGTRTAYVQIQQGPG
jgi:hypothetical protein